MSRSHKWEGLSLFEVRKWLTAPVCAFEFDDNLRLRQRPFIYQRCQHCGLVRLRPDVNKGRWEYRENDGDLASTRKCGERILRKVLK